MGIRQAHYLSRQFIVENEKVAFGDKFAFSSHPTEHIYLEVPEFNFSFVHPSPQSETTSKIKWSSPNLVSV